MRKTTNINTTRLFLCCILAVCSIIPSSIGFTSQTHSKRLLAFAIPSSIKTKHTICFTPRQLHPGDDPGPPLNWAQSSSQPPNDASTTSESFKSMNHDEGTPEEDTGSNSVLKANRWSKYAPDASLPTEEFKNQLKENMKNDLERRRAQSPNRGNQPAKSYLDSL